MLAAAAALLLASAASGQDASFPLSLTRGSRLMIAASINAYSVHALLDSAAEATLIDRDFAKKLNLHSSSVSRGQGSGNASFEAGMVEGVQIGALGLSLPNQTVAIVDLRDVGHRLLGHRLDVILGREIFDAARLWIDIDGRRIKVVRDNQEPAGVRLELISEHGVETLAVRVEGSEPKRATFDLGNGGAPACFDRWTKHQQSSRRRPRRSGDATDLQLKVARSRRAGLRGPDSDHRRAAQCF
jgi:hypothetical protein